MGDWGGQCLYPLKSCPWAASAWQKQPLLGGGSTGRSRGPCTNAIPHPCIASGNSQPCAARQTQREAEPTLTRGQQRGARLQAQLAPRISVSPPAEGVSHQAGTNPPHAIPRDSAPPQLRAASPDPAVPAPDPNPSPPCPPSPVRLRACHGCNSRLNRLVGPQCQSRGGIQKAAEVLE